MYGTHSQGISQFYLHTCIHLLTDEPYVPFPSKPKLVLIYQPHRDHGRLNVWHRELNPDTVTHLSTNRARVPNTG